MFVCVCDLHAFLRLRVMQQPSQRERYNTKKISTSGVAQGSRWSLSRYPDKNIWTPATLSAHSDSHPFSRLKFRPTASCRLPLERTLIRNAVPVGKRLRVHLKLSGGEEDP